MALMAPHWGADRVAILDRTPSRLQRAQAIDLLTFNVDEPDVEDQIRTWANDKGPHSVIVTTANYKAVDMGFNLTGAGGTLLLYGVPAPGNPYPLDVNRMFFQEIYVTGSYSAGPFDTRRALSLLSNKVIDANVLITHRFPLEQSDQAWHMTKQAGDSLKVMVEI
jgi:L-iditol 2-dehydrogenase